MTYQLQIRCIQYNVEGYSPIKFHCRYKYFFRDFHTIVSSKDFIYTEN